MNRTADAPEFLPHTDDLQQQDDDRRAQELEVSRILRRLHSMRHRGQIGRNVISLEEIRALAKACNVRL